jgi:hypothetical protein
MVPPARTLQDSRMSPHWTVYAAGACSIALAIAIIAMMLLM